MDFERITTSSSFMIPIRDNCYNLKTLKLKFTEWNDKNFSRGFTKMKQLDTFTMHSDNYMSLGCISTLPKTIKNVYMFKDPTQLHNNLHNRRANDVRAIDKIKDVTSLTLIGLNLMLPVIESINGKKNLVHLDLSFSRLNIPSNLLTNLENLEHLDLHKSKGFIDDSMFTNVSSNCPKLKYLNLNDCHIKLSTRGLDEIANLRNLEFLMINTIRNQLNGSSFARMKKLKVLECICCVNVNNNNIMGLLRNAPGLRRLVVIHTGITGIIMNDVVTLGNYRKSDVGLKIILSSSSMTSSHVQQQQIPPWLTIQEVDYYTHDNNLVPEIGDGGIPNEE
ncbi:hypothetical protein HCN44_001628 [Aphidius gifuensis]|uniref:Uncharacterized protein n=2 Tax=Aphidius gifuensis TaxID=684658 RepID=A0A834XTP5_APHGI|nr:hypothetical protein HCN44_001628 [Aphidius gifuensis]